MTVKELKEYLLQFDDNLKVFVTDWNEEYSEPTEMKYDYIVIDKDYQKKYEDFIRKYS